MRDPHVPHDEFVTRLESKIGREVRRRNAVAEPAGWWPRTRLRAVVGIATVSLVSMAIGGVVVAAAYQARGNDRRDALSAAYQLRADLARQRLTMATKELTNAEQRSAVGVGTKDEMLEARAKVVDAEAQVKNVDLQLEEIRVTAREPLDDASSPLVSGRDFVTERWKVGLSEPAATLEFAQQRLRSAEQRVSVGVADAFEVQTAQTHVVEVQAGIEAFQRKLDIRQRFLKGEITAAMADLRVLEADAEQRRKALVPRIDLARKNADLQEQRFRVGTANPVDRMEAQATLLRLQTELANLDVDLAVVREKIDRLRGK